MEPNVVLRGRLLCADDDEAAIVVRLLPRHIELTRAEPGCLSFTVQQNAEDPRTWDVDERFVDAAAYQAHQDRARSSEWGHATAGIRRDYTLE
ncbi:MULTISPECIES: putative quinol monooxygenase [unclassified Gordonia (in: high G+C Gram-positive bacteria)]|uniref:putative quinol monooxygenase n=1 Tax=unclassified Gordonia (in: high G+C Gram-positive bacteria) TaxID=2657482 RepID=UPI001F0D9981|nr:antibiotic biosynthesis monooxygenase [Gordonia sp. ABSL49_1]MCH5643872.1 antibiotic biosynthesis monooxygenase [Gordonia sp. ABSL49_1]